MYEYLAPSLVALFFSLIILWITSLSMIKDKAILCYLPFFVSGAILVLYAVFMSYSIFWDVAWVFLEASIFVDLVWILLVLRRYGK